MAAGEFPLYTMKLCFNVSFVRDVHIAVKKALRALRRHNALQNCFTERPTGQKYFFYKTLEQFIKEFQLKQKCSMPC